MYELIEMACMVVIGIMGILMAVVPQKVAKKSIAENPSKLIVVRILGVLMAVGCAVVLFIIFRYNYSPMLGARYAF